MNDDHKDILKNILATLEDIGTDLRDIYGSEGTTIMNRMYLLNARKSLLDIQENIMSIIENVNGVSGDGGIDEYSGFVPPKG